MSDTLNAVMNSGQPWAAERAQYALQVHDGVVQGQLSPDEAKEILADLINTQKLDEASSDMQLRAALVYGVSELISMY